jgi:hypothetical protein
MRRVRPAILLLIGAMVGAIAVTPVMAGRSPSGAEPSAVVPRNGSTVTAVRTVTNNEDDFTNSQTYSTVPGMTTTVTVPSGQQALLVITFAAQTQCLQDGLDSVFCILRVRVGSSNAAPGEVIFDSASDGNDLLAWETNSMQFVRGPLGPGTYTVQVQYRVDEANSQFGVNARTLTVLRVNA